MLISWSPITNDCLQMVDMDTDTDAGFLCTWQQCHTDTIAAIDINAEKQQVSFSPN